jgi:hypothetical protein
MKIGVHYIITVMMSLAPIFIGSQQSKLFGLAAVGTNKNILFLIAPIFNFKSLTKFANFVLYIYFQIF